MRSPLVLSVLAALLVASVVFAAKPESATADISQLGASGISGTADFKLMSDGDVRVHEQLSGLTPGAQYESVVYLAAAGCGSGTAVEIIQFTANNAGKANFNLVVPPQAVPAISGGSFISVEQGTTVLACGAIVNQ